MFDSAFSWALLMVAEWIAIGVFVARVIKHPSVKRTESEYITKVFKL